MLRVFSRRDAEVRHAEPEDDRHQSCGQRQKHPDPPVTVSEEVPAEEGALATASAMSRTAASAAARRRLEMGRTGPPARPAPRTRDRIRRRSPQPDRPACVAPGLTWHARRRRRAPRRSRRASPVEAHPEAAGVLVELLGPRGADDRRRDVRLAQDPGERELRQRQPGVRPRSGAGGRQPRRPRR